MPSRVENIAMAQRATPFCPFVVVLTSLLFVVSGLAPAADSSDLVRVRQVKTDRGARLFVENRALWDVTVTLKVLVRNGRLSRVQPETATYPARSETEAAQIWPENSGRRCQWRCRIDWIVGRLQNPGRTEAPADKNVLYHLPFEEGRAFRVAQGYDTNRTHKGRDRYSVDFVMRKGTSVCAARAGIVVDLKESSKTGGSNEKFRSDSNYVCIAHADGTVAEYHHLHYDGVLVEIGERVETGQRIAISGNTGYSTGPHLHFGVYTAVDGRRSQSHPITFVTAEGLIRKPVEGAVYTAR